MTDFRSAEINANNSSAVINQLIAGGNILREGLQMRGPSALAERLTFQVFNGANAIAFAQLSARRSRRRQHEDNSAAADGNESSPGVSYCLKMIEVNHQYRGLGVGSALLREIIDFCRDQQVGSLHGEACGDLTFLRRWYRNQGFELDPVDNIRLSLTAG